MSLSENAQQLFKLGFAQMPNELVYRKGEVTVTFIEAMNHDWTHLQHLIDTRARAVGQEQLIYAKTKNGRPA